MKEYIERAAVIPAINKAMSKYGTLGLTEIEDVIDEIPAADVRPLKTSEWVLDKWSGHHYCLRCAGEAFRDNDKEYLTNYCENCGADMRASIQLKGVAHETG